MDVGHIAFYTFAASSTLYIVHFGLYLIGANFYDMRQFGWKRRLTQKPLDDNEALVSVLIPAHNEEKVIVRCLESVIRSTYRNLQIIVVDDASQDGTYSLALNFKRAHPKSDISIVRRHKRVGKGCALNYALKYRAQGSYVMTLDADSMVTPASISNAISYFTDPSVLGVAANVRLIEIPTVLGILQKFEHMIAYRSKKMYSFARCEYIVGGVASTYRMNVLRELGFYDTDTLTEDIGLSLKVLDHKGNRHYQVVYAADVIAYTEPVPTFIGLLKQRYRWKYGSLQNIIKYRHLIGSSEPKFTRSLTWYRLPMALIGEFILLLMPIAWSFVIYLSLVANGMQLIIGAYLTVTCYTLIILWFDEHLSLRYRLHLTRYMLLLYFLFYIMDIVQFVAAVRCLFNSRQLINRKKIRTSWVSPKRVGHQPVTN